MDIQSDMTRNICHVSNKNFTSSVKAVMSIIPRDMRRPYGGPWKAMGMVCWRKWDGRRWSPRNPPGDLSMTCLEPRYAVDITVVIPRGNFLLGTQYTACHILSNMNSNVIKHFHCVPVGLKYSKRYCPICEDESTYDSWGIRIVQMHFSLTRVALKLFSRRYMWLKGKNS